MKKIVEIKNLTKLYNDQKSGIKNISFDIYEGKFHAFIGSNGSGKTTTIKSLVNAYSKFQGEILINGILNTNASAKSLIGYIPEHPKFPPFFTTWDYLYAFALLNYNKQEASEKVDKLIKQFKLEKLKDLKPFNFSSGQKKKVLLSQSIINDPKILIMDEPTANLDPLARRELFEILNSYKELGNTIFISTHELFEISRFVDYVTIIHLGDIIYSGPFLKNSNLEEFYFQKLKEHKKNYEK
ncbi:ABC transporter ATP-binding protein [Mesomycoplasma lagogenitalium]|uniref:ABC transporter ATP-binding protein n=1 Tax=Mesomycoplasma lagogenitalium TaxID=171286 RepID=A0ABY8LUP5_9BACT|nr:ABC transporter ATP-binding protein [Mesomycoplasma lagogenitalium]WGI36950.1 ABC transporter ATP-binding protein [Mesomycoplasma lagogenitalium]